MKPRTLTLLLAALLLISAPLRAQEAEAKAAGHVHASSAEETSPDKKTTTTRQMPGMASGMVNMDKTMDAIGKLENAMAAQNALLKAQSDAIGILTKRIEALEAQNNTKGKKK
jgi:uncharacterized protein involved in copper resistance